MTDQRHPGGIGNIGTHTVARVGYGAMQLFEPAPDDATAVLRRAVELGVNHIDTASFYGPGEVNRRIKAALSPYRDDLVIVSKVGARYTGEEPIPLAAAQRPAELRAAVEDDLRQLGVDCVPAVNLRRMDLGPGVAAEGDQIVDLDDQLAEMIALRDEGKIGGIGISSVPLEILQRALPAGIVCVQNAYSLLDRSQEAMLELCRAEDIAWVPYFPLGSAFPGFPKAADNDVVRDNRRRAKRHTGTGRAGLAAGSRAERAVDRRHQIDRPSRGEHGRGSRHAERGSAGAPGRRHRAGGRPVAARHREVRRPEPDEYGRPMSKSVRPPWWLKPANKLFIRMSRLGLNFGGEGPVVLTVSGRTSGRERSTPVTPMTVDGQEYVVAGFPGADWVANVRAAGEATVARGRSVRAGADGGVVRRRRPPVVAGLPDRGAHGRRLHETGRPGHRRTARGIRGTGRPLRGLSTGPESN